MDSSTLVSDLTTVSCNTSMVSIRKTNSSSIMSQETDAGPFVLTKDDENENENENSTVNSTMWSYPTTAPDDMFPPYQCDL